jgi:hypothetical protein
MFCLSAALCGLASMGCYTLDANPNREIGPGKGLLTTEEINARQRWQLLTMRLELERHKAYIKMLEDAAVQGLRSYTPEERIQLLQERIAAGSK